MIVGKGALLDVVERLRDDFPSTVVHHRELAPVDVARLMDESTCLVLPSRSEGLGRVLIESFARGRGVVASRVGGIPDVVRDGVEGLLVDPFDDDDIARALTEVLSDRELAERLGAAARVRYRDWDCVARRLRRTRALARRPHGRRDTPLTRAARLRHAGDRQRRPEPGRRRRLGSCAGRALRRGARDRRPRAHPRAACERQPRDLRLRLARRAAASATNVRSSRRLHEPRPDAMLVHMVPLFLLLAAPVARVRRVPLLLWYTHWRGDWTLRVADRLCAAVLSVDRASYPLDSSKLHAIGHGIDVSRFAERNGRHVAGGTLRLRRARPHGAVEGLPDPARRFRAGALAGPRRPARDPRAEHEGGGARASRRARRPDRRQLGRSRRIPSSASRCRASRSRGSSRRRMRSSRRPTAAGDADARQGRLRGLGVRGPGDRLESRACRLSRRAPAPPRDSAPGIRPISRAPSSSSRPRLSDVREAAGLELRRRVEQGHSIDTWADRVLAVVEEVRR